MRLEQLHYFETLIQECSFTKAAEKLHISQPSLTASIKAMEKELDTHLLVRDTRSFNITDEGKQVLAFAKDTLTAYHKLLHNLHQEEKQITGTITITASKFFCELILEQFMHTLHTSHTQLKVRMIQNDYLMTPEQYVDTGCKLGILTRISDEENKQWEDSMVSSEDFYDAQYEYLPLFTDTFGFCVAKASPLSSIAPIYPNTLTQFHFPTTLFPVGVTNSTDEVLLTSSNAQLHVETMLEENAYCSIPYFVYQHYFAQEETLTYRAFSNNLTITYYLVYPAVHTLSQAEQLFIEELQRYLAKMNFK